MAGKAPNLACGAMSGASPSGEMDHTLTPEAPSPTASSKPASSKPPSRTASAEAPSDTASPGAMDSGGAARSRPLPNTGAGSGLLETLAFFRDA